MRCFRSFRTCYCCESKEFPLAVDFELIYPGRLVGINTPNVMKKNKNKMCDVFSLIWNNSLNNAHLEMIQSPRVTA